MDPETQSTILIIGAVFSGLCSLVAAIGVAVVGVLQVRMKAKTDADAQTATAARLSQSKKLDAVEMKVDVVKEQGNSLTASHLRDSMTFSRGLYMATHDPNDKRNADVAEAAYRNHMLQQQDTDARAVEVARLASVPVVMVAPVVETPAKKEGQI